MDSCWRASPCVVAAPPAGGVCGWNCCGRGILLSIGLAKCSHARNDAGTTGIKGFEGMLFSLGVVPSSIGRQLSGQANRVDF